LASTGIGRRQFMQALGIGAAAALAGTLGGRGAIAGPFEANEFGDEFGKLVPEDKKLDPRWFQTLSERGESAVYRGAELEKIGMPVGGVGAGQIYLGGDGRLWLWDIFNQHRGTGAEHYAKPMRADSPIEQGFAIRVGGAAAKNDAQIRPLDASGFKDVSFRGEYPVGRVEYGDERCPVSVSLEAFSPFIPLNAKDSALPATIMRFTVRNHSAERADVTLAGWMQNAVCLHSGAAAGAGGRKNAVYRDESGLTMLACTAFDGERQAEKAPPTVFADFEGKTYTSIAGDWKVEGDAFGAGPSTGPQGTEQHLSGYLGKGLVNTYQHADRQTGKLTSPEFKIERPFIRFRIGGGHHPGQTCINLLVDGKVARTETGQDSDAMVPASWDVKDLAGKTGRLEIVDNHTGIWGHIDIDQIEFADAPHDAGPLSAQADFGSMVLALRHEPGEDAVGAGGTDLGGANLPDDKGPDALFAEHSLELVDPKPREITQPMNVRLAGGLGRQVMIEPGKEAVVTFVIAWHFRNLTLKGLPGVVGRRYAEHLHGAGEVACYIAIYFKSLRERTLLWRDTWYDSTLPYWFLDRTMANTSTLATSTAFWFASGRFYGWEGVGCCPGTCTHVWHYAQAVGRLFPELERSAREMADYQPGAGFNPTNGLIDFRGEFHNGFAVDGQSGTILRVWREHQMSADDAFLRRLWPRVKQSIEYLMKHDAEDGAADGIMEGGQPNTLDTVWWGPIAWLSSLYIAALRAGEEMAKEVGDTDFAKRAGDLAESGKRKLIELTWNGEYFIQKPDPKHPEAMKSGDGCEIDQVFGQSWAFQVGLGRIIDSEHARGALQSLWKYNFTSDVGPPAGPVVRHARRGRLAHVYLAPRRQSRRPRQGPRLGLRLLQRMHDRLRAPSRRPHAMGGPGYRGPGHRAHHPRPLSPLP
jgi:non-lysosomal glucosylceramidase